MKNEHTSSTAPLLLGMAAGAALGAAGVMATNTSERQMRRTARKLAKGAEHAVSQLDKMVDDFVERRFYFRYASALLQISSSIFSAASLFSALTEI